MEDVRPKTCLSCRLAREKARLFSICPAIAPPAANTSLYITRAMDYFDLLPDAQTTVAVGSGHGQATNIIQKEPQL
ncbi:MAG: hypothetical protein HQL87_02600 [Magnetococcales bacterium]|nr:hypothetical protein [Magnetococcales bacterium]